MGVAYSERYSRQAIFSGIGEEGQKKIARARIAVVGVGALGTVIANNLARAGVGYLRLIDRDFVDMSNLQRQTLYDENDVRERLPKAVAAAAHLQKINSELALEPVVDDVNPDSIETLLEDVDLVMDGTDNFETRLLLNDVCLKHGLPWIYGGAVGSYGMTMNILPGETPCFRCLIPQIPAPGTQPTCSTAGVLNMITGLIGCYQSAEAVKYLLQSPALRREALYLDVWKNHFHSFSVERDAACPACVQGRYEFLDNRLSSYTTSLCGNQAVQIVPQVKGSLDLEKMARKLRPLGEVSYNKFILQCTLHDLEITLFPDGRAIIKGVQDQQAAKSVYAEYIGL
jgi:adenylyltransferase/sulfurtransferase